MRVLMLLLLLALFTFMFFTPISHFPVDFERAKVIRANSYVILQGSSGVLEVKVSEKVTEVGRTDNIYDFFSLFVETSKIERIEIVPTPFGISCRVVTPFGKNYAGKIEFCIALALRKEIPVYVHKDLFREERHIALGF